MLSMSSSEIETGFTKRDSHTTGPEQQQSPTTGIPSPTERRRVHICRNDDPAACCFASSSKHGAHNILEGKRYSTTNGLHQDRTSSRSNRDNSIARIRDGVIGEISSRDETPIFPVPNDSENYQVVRQYLHKILTKAEWGLATNHQRAIRATLNNWSGTGWELRRNFQVYQMRDICPATVKILRDGTAKVIHFAPEVRVWIAACVVREMQLYFKQEMQGVMGRPKIPCYRKASGKCASTSSSSPLSETLVTSCKSGEVQHVKISKRSSTSRPALPSEWLPRSRPSVAGRVRPISDGISASGFSSDRNRNGASQPDHSPPLRSARPLAHFYPGRIAGHLDPTGKPLNSQQSSKSRSSILGSLRFSRGGLPSLTQCDDELRGVRFEETACEVPPVTELAQVRVKRNPTILASGAQPATLQPTQLKLDNVRGTRVDSSRPSDERIATMCDTTEGSLKVLPKKNSIGKLFGSVLSKIKMPTKYKLHRSWTKEKDAAHMQRL